MSSTDFIGDFLTRIRNASRAGQEKFAAPASKITLKIVEILKNEGFVENFKPFNEGNKNFVRIHLRYVKGSRQAVIQGLRRISRPGRRIYVPSDKIPRVIGGLGISVVSTSKGLMVDREARKARMGGELICKVW